MSVVDTKPNGSDWRFGGQLYRIGPFTAKLMPTPLACLLTFLSGSKRAS